MTSPPVPGTVHAPQAMGTKPEGHRVLQEGLGLRPGAEDRDRVICAWTTLLPPTSDRFAFSLLQFQLFPKALLAMVVAVIVSSVFDPLTGTQIHGLGWLLAEASGSNFPFVFQILMNVPVPWA